MTNRKKWQRCVVNRVYLWSDFILADRIGGSSIPLVEEILNDFVKEGKIDGWKYSGEPAYEVLTERDITEIKKDIMFELSIRIRKYRR
ncbi:MAG: hypothetical protein ACE5Z5_00760 [Candidatus Bathyarchaeia archaeon]